MKKRKRVGGDLFSPSLSSLTFVFKSFFSRVLSPWAFPLYCFLLTDIAPDNLQAKYPDALHCMLIPGKLDWTGLAQNTGQIR